MTGCSTLFVTEVWKGGVKIGEVKSNVPAKIKSGDFEVEQRNETKIQKLLNSLPTNINIEK